LGVSDCLLFLAAELPPKYEVFDQIRLEWETFPPLPEKNEEADLK